MSGNVNTMGVGTCLTFLIGGGILICGGAVMAYLGGHAVATIVFGTAFIVGGAISVCMGMPGLAKKVANACQEFFKNHPPDAISKASGEARKSAQQQQHVDSIYKL